MSLCNCSIACTATVHVGVSSTLTRAGASYDDWRSLAEPNRTEPSPVPAHVHLSEVMPIHCAAALESSDATKEAFRSKNCRGGPWLPREIEISLVEREDGEAWSL